MEYLNEVDPQVHQAICDEISVTLKKHGEYPHSIEGYQNGEWVLMDYGDYLVHVFSEKARVYYDLERLWRDAKTVEVPAARSRSR